MGKAPSRLSQMADDGLHFGFQERAPTGIVVHGLQLGKQQGATLYPAVEGLHGGFGTAGRLVKQGKLSLAVRTRTEHNE